MPGLRNACGRSGRQTSHGKPRLISCGPNRTPSRIGKPRKDASSVGVHPAEASAKPGSINGGSRASSWESIGGALQSDAALCLGGALAVQQMCHSHRHATTECTWRGRHPTRGRRLCGKQRPGVCVCWDSKLGSLEAWTSPSSEVLPGRAAWARSAAKAARHVCVCVGPAVASRCVQRSVSGGCYGQCVSILAAATHVCRRVLSLPRLARLSRVMGAPSLFALQDRLLNCCFVVGRKRPEKC